MRKKAERDLYVLELRFVFRELDPVGPMQKPPGGTRGRTLECPARHRELLSAK